MVYKQVCHERCYLKNVPKDKIGDPQLEGCEAMDSGKCRHCGHEFRVHMHVTYEYVWEKVEEEDPVIKKALEEGMDGVKAREMALNGKMQKLQQLEQEKQDILAIAARFAQFLKSKSITSSKDHVIEHLKYLINVEEQTQEAGNPSRSLAALQYSPPHPNKYHSYQPF